tara:strand:- start:401 stop:844 length:444 start_codon:yes stop_codon:yes gene_type:complete
MSDELNALLNEDLGDIDTSRPILKETIATMRVKEMQVKSNKAETGNNLEITLVTMETLPNRKGDDVNANFPVFDIISLTPTEKYDADAIKRRLKEVRVAVHGPGEGAFGTPAEYIGLELEVKIGIQEDKTGKYSDRNVIKRYLPAGE